MLENVDDEVTGMGFSLGPKPVRGTSVMYSKGRSAREIFHREKDGMLGIFPAFAHVCFSAQLLACLCVPDCV